MMLLLLAALACATPSPEPTPLECGYARHVTVPVTEQALLHAQDRYDYDNVAPDRVVTTGRYHAIAIEGSPYVVAQEILRFQLGEGRVLTGRLWLNMAHYLLTEEPRNLMWTFATTDDWVKEPNEPKATAPFPLSTTGELSRWEALPLINFNLLPPYSVVTLRGWIDGGEVHSGLDEQVILRTMNSEQSPYLDLCVGP